MDDPRAAGSRTPGEPPADGPVRAAARRARDYGWMPLLALAATQLLENGERQSLAQAVEGIQTEFAVSDFAIGLLPTAALIIGALGSIPIGILTDRTRRTYLLGAAMAIWTFAIGLTGLSTTYAMLFGMRLLLGAVEANSPAAFSLITDYYPVTQRAKMIGLYQSGGLVGALIGLGIGGVAVQLGGWRWAFLMWIPAGIGVVLWLWRTTEPERGDQDHDFEAQLTADDLDDIDVGAVTGVGGANIALPPPARVGTLDYEHATTRQVLREFLKVRSMWFAIIGLGASQMLLQGLSFWGVEFFKRVHGLEAGPAGALASALALGAAVGIVGGGFLADRYFRRGVLSARVYVAGFSALAATAVLIPAFASSSLAVTAPLLVLGGTLMTLPVAPAEAMLNDVIVPHLRGRAVTVRTIVRSVANAGPLIIGGLSELWGLQTAIVAFTPIFAVGGLVVLIAARYYPSELSFVVAETRRYADLQVQRQTRPDDPSTQEDEG